MAFDYAGVSPYGDEDEDELQGGYAPAIPAPPPYAAAAAPPAYAAPPVSSAAPAFGSTEDLQSRGLASHSMPPAAAATPRPQWSQYAPPEPHGWSKFGHILAGFTRPTNNAFNVQPEQNAEKRYQMATAEYEAPAHEAAQEATTEEHESAADRDRAQANALRHPQTKQEESGKTVTTDQGVMQWNPDTQKYDIRVGGAPAKNDKPDSLDQQYSEAIASGDHAAAARLLKVKEDMARAGQAPQKPQQQLGVDGTGHVVELKPGMDATGVQNIGASEKAGAAGQSAQDALNYANDYMAGGKFTGAGDEALMEKYFELAKPSSGFRMTQAQIEMLQHARDLMGGLEARAKHLLTPEAPYFSDTQRKQIADTMGQLESSKGGAKKEGSEQQPERPTNVPKDWVHKKDGPHGSGWYKP